jgi:hypothetical protein
MAAWVTAEAFRQLVDRKMVARVGVGLDDVPDVDLADWLDDDDGIAAADADGAADDAVAFILEDNGWEGPSAGIGPQEEDT